MKRKEFAASPPPPVRKAFKASASELGPRKVRVRCSSGEVDRSGEIVVQAGLVFTQSVPVLWQHDPTQPIGRAFPVLMPDGLCADIEFAPEGISAKADEICGLVKAGVVDTVSLGFDPIEFEPMDSKRPKGPLKYLKAEVLEVSFVSVPANADAVVVQRAHGKDNQEISMSAKIEKAMKAMVRKIKRKATIKGMYEVADLAYALMQIGWVADVAEWEAAMEEDGSNVPAMLAAALQALAEAFLAMAAEEVAELLGDEAAESLTAGMAETDAATVMAGATPAVRKFRAALVKAKMRAMPDPKAKKFSVAAKACFKSVQDMTASACKMHKDAIGMHTKAMETLSALTEDDSDNAETQSTGEDAENEGETNKAAEAGRTRTIEILRRRQAA